MPSDLFLADVLSYLGSSGLPLGKARWLPRYLPPPASPQTRPGTSSQSKEDDFKTLDAAWNPSSIIPGEIPAWAVSSHYEPELTTSGKCGYDTLIFVTYNSL